jgi:hypothetical protein
MPTGNLQPDPLAHSAVRRGRTGSWRDAWRAVAPQWLASRGALWVLALAASVLVPLYRDGPLLNFTHPRPRSALFDHWARWDSEWYLAIAEAGYRYEIADPAQRARHPGNPTAGFLPLYPLLIRVLSPLTGSAVAAGWWISNLALLGFLLIWHSMLREDVGDAAARRGVFYFLILPASIFCSAVYAESLFLLLCVGCLWCLRGGRHAAAAACAFAASLTRPSGVLLAAPMALEAWRSIRAGDGGALPVGRGASPTGKGAPPAGRSATAAGRRAVAAGRCVAPLAPVAGIGLFFVFCARAFGDPLELLRRQEAWRGATGPPWRAFVRYFQTGPALHGIHNSTLELVFALGALALLRAGFKRLRRPEWVFCFLVVLTPLCTSLFSFSRLVLPAFPLLALPATWGGREWVDRALACLLLALQSLAMVLFQGWDWVA